MTKKCTFCFQEKELELFGIRKNTNRTNKIYYRSRCKQCLSLYDKDRKSQNKKKLSIKRRQYYSLNKDKENSNSKSYYRTNKIQIIKRTVSNIKFRLKNDPSFKLRYSISSSIRDSLKERLNSKNNISAWKFLPFSKNELKKHIEKQFEPWMTWKNWGRYNSEIWNDNDSSTWTWNIDHIIAHSTFKYNSMEDQSFKDCWSLSNLRPLSAKQNIIDGCRANG